MYDSTLSQLSQVVLIVLAFNIVKIVLIVVGLCLIAISVFLRIFIQNKKVFLIIVIYCTLT